MPTCSSGTTHRTRASAGPLLHRCAPAAWQQVLPSGPGVRGPAAGTLAVCERACEGTQCVRASLPVDMPSQDGCSRRPSGHSMAWSGCAQTDSVRVASPRPPPSVVLVHNSTKSCGTAARGAGESEPRGRAQSGTHASHTSRRRLPTRSATFQSTCPISRQGLENLRPPPPPRRKPCGPCHGRPPRDSITPSHSAGERAMPPMLPRYAEAANPGRAVAQSTRARDNTKT